MISELKTIFKLLDQCMNEIEELYLPKLKESNCSFFDYIGLVDDHQGLASAAA